MTAPQARAVYHPDQWHHILAAGLLPTIQQWLRDNEIDPSDVPTHTPISIEGRKKQRVIAYSAYLHDADGHKYVDPEDGNEAAREERTTPLLVEPPDTWTGGPREPQPRPLG